MQIETKLNIDNKVWIMLENKPIEHEIGSIKSNTTDTGTIIEYYARTSKYQPYTAFNEDKIGITVFMSKQELLNSL